MKKFLFLLMMAVLVAGCGADKPDFDASQQKMAGLAKRLKAIGFFNSCSEQRMDSLVLQFGHDSLNGIFHMLDKSGDLYVADMKINAANAVASYTALFNELGKRFPEAGLQSVKVEPEYVDVNDFGSPDTSFIVSLQTKDTTYRKTLFYAADYPADIEFFKHFNQLLADKKSSRRVYSVDYTCLTCPRDTFGNLPSDHSKLGLLMLNKIQSDTLFTMPVFDFMDNEFLVFSSAEIHNTVSKLEQSELMKDFPESYISHYKKEISENFFYHKDEIYDYADTIFSSIIIDSTETFEPYTQIVYILSVISNGKFEPGEISETHNENRSTVTFSLNGKMYLHTPEAKNGYIDPSFVEKINNALEEQNIGGYFYTVGHGQQYAEMVFIPDAIIDNIRRKNCFDELAKGLPEDIWKRYNGKANF